MVQEGWVATDEAARSPWSACSGLAAITSCSMKPTEQWTICDRILYCLWKWIHSRLTRSPQDEISYPARVFLTCENCFITYAVSGKEQVQLKADGLPLPAMCGNCRQGEKAVRKRRLWRETSARFAAHEVFDNLWTSGRMTRTQAYAWMRKHFGMWSTAQAHIAALTEDQCLALMVAVTLGPHGDVVPASSRCRNFDEAKRLAGKYQEKERRTEAVMKSQEQGWGIRPPY